MYTAEEVKKIIDKKVRGKVEACHTEEGHFYKIVRTGKILTSVTSKNILGMPHLTPWAVGLGIEFLEQDNRFERLKGPERNDLITAAKFQFRDVRDDAGTLGGKAHEIIEEWTNDWIATGKKPGDIRQYIERKGYDDYRVYGACRSAEAVFEKYKVVPIATELLVGHSSMGAGTLDLIVMNERGELELFDHKTSNNISDFYSAQVSAYKKIFERMTKLQIVACRILKLDKYSDKFKVYNVSDPDEAYKAFTHISKTHDWLKNNKQKLTEDKVVVKI